MTKEKHIEQSIVKYLQWLWAWVEQLQSWKVLIKKWMYNNMMTLCTNWAPDIICFYNDTFYGIEVKKNAEEVKAWIKKEQRYLSWEELPKSYKREKAQIEHKHKIIKNWWVHIITWELSEIIEYFEKL